jgi:hypothetical protein
MFSWRQKKHISPYLIDWVNPAIKIQDLFAQGFPNHGLPIGDT